MGVGYDNHKIASTIRQARLRRNLTQEQVAERIGMSPNAYGKIENGRRNVPPDIIMPLCAALGIRRLSMANICLPVFDVDDSAAASDFDGIVLVPEHYRMHDDILDRDLQPKVHVSVEEYAFGVLLSEFVGRPLMDPMVFDAFMKAVDVHRRHIVDQMLHSTDG